MQKTVLVFDLDDTLYDELSYVYSGLSAVADFLEERLKLNALLSYNEMKEILNIQGRGHVFDTLLKKHGLFSKAIVKQCLQVYRHHIPNLKLYRDAERLFERTEQYPKYIVTDGHKIVQDIKINALKLREVMKHCYITNRYGIHNNKPSPYCFLKICKQEHVDPKQVVYIADNPYKDFIGLKPFLFQTIRVLKGRYKDIQLDEAHEADRTITSLDEVLIT